MPPEEETKMLSLRVPQDLYEAIKRLADLERRKVHNLLLILIEDAVKERLAAAERNK